MKFSARDLAIVTAYSALMLAKNEALTALIIAASLAGLMLITVVFGLTTLSAFFRPFMRAGTLSASWPLPLMVLSAFGLLLFAEAVLRNSPESVGTVALSMFLSLAAATLPLLCTMEARQQQLDDQTLWTGYWTLGAATVIGGLTAIALQFTYELLNLKASVDIFRWSTVSGMIGSVFASWWLLRRQPTAQSMQAMQTNKEPGQSEGSAQEC